MDDSEFSQKLYEIINSDQLYGIVTSQAIERAKIKGKELGIEILQGEHVISDNLSEEQYKIFSTIIRKHNKELKSKPEPLPAYNIYPSKIEDNKIIELDVFYDSVLDDAKKDKAIPPHIVKDLLQRIGRPKYNINQEELFLVLYQIEIEHLKNKGSYRSAVVRYLNNLASRKPFNAYEYDLKNKYDEANPDPTYNQINKAKTALKKHIK